MSIARRQGLALMACLLLIAGAPAATVDLTPTTAKGAAIGRTTLTVEGRPCAVWSCDEKLATLVFPLAVPMAVPAGGALYLRFTYPDAGYGRISVQVTGSNGKTLKPDRYLNLARSDTGRLVTARLRFGRPGEAGTVDAVVAVRIGLERPKGEVLAVAGAVLQDTPFTDDELFTYVLGDPWNGPYTGPAQKPPDNTTLKGKVMAGYQGWFRTPNDPEGQGWRHWGGIERGQFSVDMWPDVSRYPARVLEKAAEVKLASGRPGQLFSSCWPEVADVHFRWMREHDIDGVFLQRFVNDRFHVLSGQPEWVLANVRAAANREGRLWAVEYDVSGYPDARLLETLKKDWAWFVDTFGVAKDPCYAREGGKPVVFIWGLPFPNRNFTPQTANAVVDFFVSDPRYGGNHVIGGIPGGWKRMDAAWQSHFCKYQSLLAWQSRAYAEDLEGFRRLGIPYYAQIWPGFSWANLKHLPTGDPVAYTPRDGGRFYWDLITKAAQAGCDRLFVGMFDEYDESTAIIPMSDDAPPTPSRPGVGATFSNGTGPQENGDFVLLPAAEFALNGTPPSRRVAGQDFFIRMGGRIAFPAPGAYTFAIEGAAGDGASLWVDGTRIIEVKKLDGVAVAKVPVTVAAAGPLHYRLDYRHGSATGTLRLSWEGPGLARQAVPAAVLTDAWGRFITNDGRPADQWLKLTALARDMINGRRPVGGPMPVDGTAPRP